MQGVPAGPADLYLRVAPQAASSWEHRVWHGERLSHLVDLQQLVASAEELTRSEANGWRRVGALIADALFPLDSPAWHAWDKLRREAPAGQGRLIVQLEGARATLVPWEHARFADGRLLALDLAFIRKVEPLGAPVSEAAHDGPPRVVLVEADPLLLPGASQEVPDRLPVADETAEIVGALHRAGRQYALVHVIPPTLSALQMALARQGTAIVHFNGHGVRARVPSMCFETETGRMEPVSAEALTLRTAGRVWLLILSACFSGAIPEGSASPVAFDLARAGVRWVIGMQHEMRVKDARVFAEAFYRYLAEGHPVWEAVRQGRIALAGRNARLAALPILYTAGPDNGTIQPPEPGDLKDETEQERRLLGWRLQLAPLRAATQFFGRERELVRLGELFAKAKIITLHGTGGVGKSALAHRAATRFGWRFRAGVYAVSLAGVQESSAPSPVLRLGLEVMGAEFAALPEQDQETRLIEWIRSTPCLIVADNVEDALRNARTSPEAEQALRALRLASGGAATLLVTSQDRLRWQGEWIVTVGGLEPDASSDLFQNFLSGTDLSDEDKTALNRVLEVVEHHPLAIRLLAPAWLESGLNLRELENQVDHLLKNTNDVVPEKAQHRNLEACFHYAYQALNKEDRDWLLRLSLFSAPFEKERAAQVFGVGEARLEVVLRRLADRSFLSGQPDNSAPIVYAFQPQVRPFVLRRAADEGPDLSEDQRRFSAVHLDFVAHTKERLGKTEWESLRQLVTITHQDLLQALEWTGDASVRVSGTCDLARLLEGLGHLDEAMRLYEQALELDATLRDSRRAQILQHMAGILTIRGEFDRAMELAEESLILRSSSGDEQGRASTLLVLAGVHVARGEFARAEALCSDALRLSQQMHDLRGEAAALQSMGRICAESQQSEQAMEFYQRALAICTQIGYEQGVAGMLHAMAIQHMTLGRPDKAMSLFEQSLDISRRLGYAQGHAATLHAMANVHLSREELDQAMQLFQDSLAITQSLRDPQNRAVTLLMMGQVDFHRGDRVRGLGAMLESYNVLNGMRSQKAESALKSLVEARSEVGDARFTEAWRELTGEESPPAWLPPSHS